jgi:hypothetical protein
MLGYSKNICLKIANKSQNISMSTVNSLSGTKPNSSRLGNSLSLYQYTMLYHLRYKNIFTWEMIKLKENRPQISIQTDG